MSARRRVAESKPAGIGQNRAIQGCCNGLGEGQSEDRREVEDELARGACRRIRHHDVARRLVGGDVVIDDEAGDVHLTHGVRERAEAFDVADVEDDERVERGQRRCPLCRVIDEIVPEQERKRRGPRSGVDDPGFHSELSEESRQAGNGPTCIAVGVHMGRQHDLLPGPQLCRQPLDGGSTRGWRVQQVGWLHDRGWRDKKRRLDRGAAKDNPLRGLVLPVTGAEPGPIARVPTRRDQSWSSRDHSRNRSGARAPAR